MNLVQNMNQTETLGRALGSLRTRDLHLYLLAWALSVFFMLVLSFAVAVRACIRYPNHYVDAAKSVESLSCSG